MKVKSHYEVIVCPECKGKELVEVLETFPYWTMEHECSHCGFHITKESWATIGMMFHKDMMEVLGSMKSNSKVTVITDPPYGVRRAEKWDDKDLFKKMIRPWLHESLRVAEHTVVWFCASKMIPYILRDVDPKYFHRMHVWNKPPGTQFAGASHNNIWYSIEPVLVFTKDKEKTISYGKAEPFDYDAMDAPTVPFKVWGHPTGKDVSLMARLIRHYTNEGDTVLDPFLGSGSTAEACIKTNRKFIGSELSPDISSPVSEDNPDHFGTILSRVRELARQEDMFFQKKLKRKVEEETFL